MLHIHSPTGQKNKVVRYCPICKQKRRFMIQTFEYYSAELICGGCGNKFVTVGGRCYAGKRTKEKRRQEVKAFWQK